MDFILKINTRKSCISLFLAPDRGKNALMASSQSILPINKINAVVIEFFVDSFNRNGMIFS